MTKNYLVFGFVLCLVNCALAQDKISLKDANEIHYQAKTTIQGLQSLLNVITFKDEVASQLESDMADSYDPSSNNRIFKDKDIIIEDDIDPLAKRGSTNEINVQKYLNDMIVKYEKTGDATFSFSNVTPSAIKKQKDYIYVRVKFDAKFGGKYKLKKIPYPVREREALIKMENAGGNKWNAMIMAITFYNPANPIDSTENNMLVTKDSSLTADVVSQAELDKRQKAYDQAKEEEARQIEARFQEYLKMGKDYLTVRQYKEALQIFAKAKVLKPLVPTLDKTILDAKRDSAENTYDNYKSKGDRAQVERRYEAAIQFYKQAIGLKPSADATLQPVINVITKKLAIFSLPNNKLQSGDAKGAIDECERILDLKENRKSKNEFPELYFIEALAYQKLVEINIDDSRSKEKALLNFDAAISYYPNYTEAHLARASFLIRFKGNIIGAITDYDQLTSNALDTASEKPGYFVQKAKWKDALKNWTGALADYASAIALSPKADSIYFDRGEMLYRMQKPDEARKNFDIAIELNPQNSQAFYTRGLNEMGLNDNDKAGADFAEAEKLGISPGELETIDTLSNRFYFTALDSVKKHNFKSADIFFDNALKIRSCNSLALLGKADIRFTIGEELSSQNQTANAKNSFLESIDYSKKAIKCNPNFSKAFYKEGLAQVHIDEDELAISSFSEAIRSDNNNIQAFIERGNILLAQKKYNKAEADYTQALGLLQNSYDLAKRDNLKDKAKNIVNDQSKVNQLDGQALYCLNDYPTALTALSHALDYNGNNTEALYYRGQVYYAQNDFQKSIRDFDQAIKITPHYKYYFANGWSNFKSKNYSDAINNFGNAIILDTLNTLKNKYYLRGLSYFKNKAIKEALGDFDVYNKSETSKTDTAFFADYGMVQLFAGKDADAFKNFNQTIALSAANSKALFGLACYYAKTHNFDKVLDLMQKAFSKNELNKDDIRAEEDLFLVDFNKVKANRVKYDELKKAVH